MTYWTVAAISLLAFCFGSPSRASVILLLRRPSQECVLALAESWLMLRSLYEKHNETIKPEGINATGNITVHAKRVEGSRQYRQDRLGGTQAESKLTCELADREDLPSSNGSKTN